MPNVMVALPNIGGALCPTPQSLADAESPTFMPSSNAAKTRNPLKFAGVPQTTGYISTVSGPSSPYYEEMWRTYCCLTSFFYSARNARIASAVLLRQFRMSVRQSVCPSHAGIVSKRRHVAQCSLHRWIAKCV